jgi:RHS repeat-associated protein
VPLADANGNITEYISGSSGTVVARYAYDAFGGTIAQSGPMAGAFAHRFSTKYLDTETGLYYYGRRFYDPAWGRWLNRDPIEEDGGLNLYGFCGNDGVNGVDAVGLYTITDARTSLRKRGVQELGSSYQPIQKYRTDGTIGFGYEWVFYYTESQIFDEWLRLEQTRGAWWIVLPKCPTKICFDEKKMPKNPNSSIWLSPVKANQKYHPDGVWEIRTNGNAQGAPHGNQCVYDDAGMLITTYSDEKPTAGSADYYGPRRGFLGVGGVRSHILHDVDTFSLAKKLNRISDYYDVRPIW